MEMFAWNLMPSKQPAQVSSARPGGLWLVLVSPIARLAGSSIFGSSVRPVWQGK